MKGLHPRAYNILFHTHTVTGIVISAVLFVIFFAGAISLYKQEIYQWEDPQARIPLVKDIDYDRLIQRLDSLRPGVVQADEVRIRMPTKTRPVYTLYAPIEDSTGTHYLTFHYNPVTDAVIDPTDGNGSTTGETLYRLHFLDQVPWYIGRYIAGFVSLFFAFAVITGLLIHWKNIVAKWYAFSFRQAAKRFWTNAHTVFGIIGLPFQLMYAITGAFYMLSVFILAPAVLVVFKGDQDRLITMIYPPEAFHTHGEAATPAPHMPIHEGVKRIRTDYRGYDIAYLDIINPGKVGAALSADLLDRQAYNGNGTVVLDLHDGTYKLEIPPGGRTYSQSILQGIANIHFADFGGRVVKALYFILSIFTCFVIVSGVLIWKEARNKPAYTDRQRRFHHLVTMIYLAVCFGLFPATAFLFVVEQLIAPGTGHAHTVNTLFFWGWLAFAAFGYATGTTARVTRINLLVGGVLACLVPVANGIATGDWMWQSGGTAIYVFLTDAAWLLTGLLALAIGVPQLVRSRNLPGG